ncbi:hypothetical protein KVF89_05665 [Nocardioides carbamazepini]|uniref:hypothetical protein n=1 Tax=Nocardioides carbamazepini TaxID=2854259 RepID=UPI00214A6E24|nr:hypothetical protein [Nocardioides carbamazepini]MCR1782014.1 hypothetical protein [Nocardioides carbamazepini]
MFSRSRSAAEGEPQADAPPESTGDEAARAFDQVLSALQPPGSPAAEPDVATVAADAEEHAATLRATRGAHREAQAMLTLASQAREEASEEAERIVLEARDAAERTRQEVAGWAAAQRAKVDALAADLAASARRDADTIRAEALRTSMAEAEETARRYVAEAAEGAQRDAEAIRTEARLVLERASELGEEVGEAITDLTAAASAVRSRLQDAGTAMERLLAENPAPEPEPGDLVAEDPDEAPEQGPVAEDLGDQDLGAEDLGAGDLDDEASDAVELDAEDPFPSEDVVSASDELTEPDRQLGSMFRRQGHHGRASGH